jgi:F420-dependent oxidoreductase-like protein
MSFVKLAYRLELYRAARLAVPLEAVRRAEAAGYHSVWTAEAYGTDALSPLAYLAGLTERIKLGTAVVQLAARPAATLAMHAMTIDALAGGGRVIVGIGVSGPQIVEGWYGQPWGRPNLRLRDYVEITRKVLDREGPVTHDGPEISLPYRGPGSIGQGKPLRSILHPAGRIPIWLASGGPRNTELCAELCDGWLPMGFGPEGIETYRESLEEGFGRRGPDDPRRRDDFEVFTGCSVRITDDVRGALDAMRPLTAMYVGGMGSESHNFHRDAMARRGFPEAAARVNELWRAGRRDEAMAAIPDEYLEQNALVGSVDRIRHRWDEGIVPAGATGVIVGTDQLEAIDLMADLAGTREASDA